MEWADSGKGNRNPEIVINGNKGLSTIEIKVAPGERVLLDISGSKDADGDEVKYKLFSMDEVATSLPVDNISQEGNGNFAVEIPENCGSKELHLICEVTDSGSIPLTS